MGMATGRIVLAVFAATLVLACTRQSNASPSTETVLSDGMAIVAHTSNETITIEGKPGFERTYSGKDWSKTSSLIPRKTRWYGSLGLYDPARSFSLGGRLLLDEGRQFFESESEALRYLQFLS